MYIVVYMYLHVFKKKKKNVPAVCLILTRKIRDQFKKN